MPFLAIIPKTQKLNSKGYIYTCVNQHAWYNSQDMEITQIPKSRLNDWKRQSSLLSSPSHPPSLPLILSLSPSQTTVKPERMKSALLWMELEIIILSEVKERGRE